MCERERVNERRAEDIGERRGKEEKGERKVREEEKGGGGIGEKGRMEGREKGGERWGTSYFQFIQIFSYNPSHTLSGATHVKYVSTVATPYALLTDDHGITLLSI